MNSTFIIIDDDISVISMLKNIIKKNKLGSVVSEYTSGKGVVDEILFYNPDIVLVDYLLPACHGVEIVNNIIKAGYKGKIIMISQVEDPEMVASAYNKGVLFFIKKPINIIEVTNVIKNLIRNIELENSMSIIKDALGDVSPESGSQSPQERNQEIIYNILSDVGIVSDAGTRNLIELINIVGDVKRREDSSSYNLQKLYKEMAYKEGVNPNTIEQRIRRAVQKSLVTTAEFGIDDYYNPKFTEYSTLLFEFTQVKQEMNYIKGQTRRRGKVNIRKFVEGILSKLY